MDNPTTEGLVIALLVALSAVYSGMETALVNLSDIKLRTRIESGTKTPEMLRRWFETPNDVLATLLIGNNIVNILASALATDLTHRLLAGTAFAGLGIPIAVGVMTILVLVFGEVVPKTYAKHHSHQYLHLLPVIQLSFWVFAILRWPLVRATQSILRGVKAEIFTDKARVTEEDIEEMVRIGKMDGSIAPESSRLLTGVLELDEKVAREIMVPRTEMAAIEVSESTEGVLRVIRESGYSRYPVYEGTHDQIVGVLYAKDLLSEILEKGADAIDLRLLAREPLVVPENVAVPDVLVAMKRQRVHMAIVASEYGGVDGIVTLEDIVEEVFGPIYDEHDAQNEEFVALEDGSLVVEGSFTIADLEEQLGLELHHEDDDYETVAGMLMKTAGKVPEAGFVLEQQGWRFEVLGSDATRVLDVRICQVESELEAPAAATEEPPPRETVS